MALEINPERVQAMVVSVEAQEQPQEPPKADRSATGGAQTLEDIMKRQRGEAVDYDFRRNATGDPDSAAGMTNQLGTLGGVSDPELWRALRFGSADITVSSGGKEATVLMQDGGMRWLEIRNGPLKTYGAYLLAGTLAFLVLFRSLPLSLPSMWPTRGALSLLWRLPWPSLSSS